MNEYKKFSYYFDEVVSSLDYDLWLEFIEPYLKDGDTILDLACGSGTLLTMLKLKGYDCEGLDLSSDIIDIANEKAKINHLRIPYYVEDMTDFNLNKQYDMITCFFDSVNFLKTKEDIDNMFTCVKKHLKKGGLFIFDIFSETMFKEYDNNLIEEDYHTFKIKWLTKKINSTTLKHDITITEGDVVFNESYYEYYHKLKSLNLDGFKLVKLCGDFNDDLMAEDERILVVLQAI